MCVDVDKQRDFRSDEITREFEMDEMSSISNPVAKIPLP